MQRIRLGALVLMLLAGLVPTVGVGAQIPRRNRAVEADQVVQSSVLIFGGLECETAPAVGNEELQAPVLDTCSAGWTGSGTVVDPTGLVLTNAHIALADDGSPRWTAVALTTDPNELPTLAFFAAPMIYDQAIDLAVLIPVFTLDGELIGEGELELPPLLIPAEAGAMAPGDAVRLIGYPGLEEDETVSITEAEVVEQLPDQDNPEVGWFDVGPFAGPGISGGAAVNDQGILVGVPTGGRAGDEGGQPNDYVRPLPEALGVLVERAEAAGQLGEQPQEDPTPAPEPPQRQPRRQPEPRPPEPPAADTSIVTGTLVSADTGEPIEGGLFLVLQPGTTVQDFVDAEGDSALVYAVGVSNGTGFFQVEPAVQQGQGYSIVILAQGYRPLSGDDILLAEAGGPATVDIGTLEMSLAQ
jgi:hypothetical protein